MCLKRALGELGMRYPSAEELEREYARRIAHEIVSHKRSPYDDAGRAGVGLRWGMDDGCVWAERVE
jgi:hypothetical protein